MDWTQAYAIIGSNLVMLIAILSLTVTMFLKDGEKIDQHRKETNDILKGIQDEMKDFHGRMCAIEERRKLDK